METHIQGVKHRFHHCAFVIFIKCHKTSRFMFRLLMEMVKLSRFTETGCDAHMFTRGEGRRLMYQKNTNWLPSQPVAGGIFQFAVSFLSTRLGHLSILPRHVIFIIVWELKVSQHHVVSSHMTLKYWTGNQLLSKLCLLYLNVCIMAAAIWVFGS